MGKDEKKQTLVSLRLDTDLATLLDEQAKKERRTKTAVITYALESYLNAQKKNNQERK